MTLQELFASVSGARLSTTAENPALEISGIAYDSRLVQPGDLFFAIHGFQQDGAKFIGDALARGAAAVASELPQDAEPAAKGVPWVQVPDARKALALAANAFYRRPSRELQLVGITGTNGKTTTAFLVASILDAAGRRPALIGTVENRLAFSEPAGRTAASQTTPESLDLQRMLRRAVDGGGRAAVMEVSSHSLVLERVTGCEFHTAIWTNFSRDHLDFHRDLDSYYAAKERLFLVREETPAPRFAVLNADDTRVASLAPRVKQAGTKVVLFGLEGHSGVYARRWKSGPSGTEFTAQTPAGPLAVSSRLVGRHNVYNLLAAVAAALTLDVGHDEIRRGIAGVTVPGRMEAVDEGQPFGVFVDYAHTDDALKNLIASAREITGEGHLILVFGCGGDRDRSKRPLMGMAAAACDEVVLTSDNPRSEDPLQILNDVMVGLQRASAKYVVEPDREAAIERALRAARPGDTVLIAGKGHECYQIVGNSRLPFDDREVARRILRRMAG